MSEYYLCRTEITEITEKNGWFAISPFTLCALCEIENENINPANDENVFQVVLRCKP